MGYLIEIVFWLASLFMCFALIAAAVDKARHRGGTR